MTHPFAQPMLLVTRTRGAPDAYGNDTWTTSETAMRGVFAPGRSVESVQGQDLLVTQPTVYLPAGTDVAAVDAVIVAGQTFEVDGSASTWTSPLTGWNAGVEVRLRGVTG